MTCNKFLIIIVCLLIAGIGCQNEPTTIKSSYQYIPPKYGQVTVECTNDTLHFLLNDTSYNDIESMNYFMDKGNEYLSFFDQRSSTILIYEIFNGNVISRIPLKRFFNKHSLHKTSIFVKNFDSILITNRTTLYLFDSSGYEKKSIPFLDYHLDTKALLDNSCAPVFSGVKLITGTRPSVFDERIKTYQKWKVLNEFNLENDREKLQYNLPEIYSEHLYGYQYLHYSFCFNYNTKHFVFSFAADTSIYETDLSKYHMSYYGKSFYQDELIKWKNGKKDRAEDYKNYITHQAYGPIYFDSISHRYLRIAKRKISENEVELKNMNREQSVIIFDKNFRIIGEAPINKGIDFNTLFFTRNGSMYARVNQRDEYALHFVRLQYKEENSPSQLTKK